MDSYPIFIAYRANDNLDAVLRIDEALSKQFGQQKIFMAARNASKASGLPAGSDDMYITLAKNAKVFLIIIGKNWIGACDKDGNLESNNPLNNPTDTHRREIEAAISTSGVKVIPVFLKHGLGLKNINLPEKVKKALDETGKHLNLSSNEEFDISMGPLYEDIIDIGFSPEIQTPERDTTRRDDLKNIITDRGISARLLQENQNKIPSLISCVKRTRTGYFSPDDKSHPFIPGWTYNHFVGIDLILVDDKTPLKPKLLSYYRVQKLHENENRTLKGESILFQASYKYSLEGEESPMDKWIQSFHREGNPRTQNDFTKVPGGILFNLFDYKMAIGKDIDGICVPFGVATVDQRNTNARRVYTHYIFIAKLNSKKSLSTQFTMKYSNGNRSHQKISTLSPSLTPDEFLKQGKALDSLVLRAYLKPNETIAPVSLVDGCKAHFSRGFNIN